MFKLTTLVDIEGTELTLNVVDTHENLEVKIQENSEKCCIYGFLLVLKVMCYSQKKSIKFLTFVTICIPVGRFTKKVWQNFDLEDRVNSLKKNFLV